MGIGANLKQILKNRNITIKQLAKETKISQNTLYNITSKDFVVVTDENIEKITTYLGITPTELIYGHFDTPMTFIEKNFPETKNNSNNPRDLHYWNDVSSRLHIDIKLIYRDCLEYLGYTSEQASEEDLTEVYTFLSRIPESTAKLIVRSIQLKQMEHHFSMLNEDGRFEALQRIYEMTCIRKYTEKENG